jgi:hypothetical protein
MHNGPARSWADSHGQRPSGLDLRHSLPSQVTTAPNPALQAGGQRGLSRPPNRAALKAF